MSKKKRGISKGQMHESLRGDESHAAGILLVLDLYPPQTFN